MRASALHPVLLAVIAGLCVLLPSSQTVAEVVVPFGAAHSYEFYTYEQGDIWDGIPFEVDAIDFDDSAWAVGHAPFGVVSPTCSFLPQTPWEVDDDIIVVRVKFFLPAGAGSAHINVWNSDDYNLSLDGVRRIWVQQFQINCPHSSHIHVHQLDTSVAGDHVVVIYARSNGPWGGDEPHQYLDVEVRAPLPSLVSEGRWGSIKALYR
jgi:hypothetical protein